jgi:hypothetical protein
MDAELDDEPTPDEPTPVVVANPDPLPVAIVSGDAPKSRRASDVEAATIHAAARVAADKSRVDDQQRISGIWERTQQVIALAVVLDVLAVSTLVVLIPALLLLAGQPIDEAAKAAAVGGLLFLTSTTSLVIGFYFGRTNHQRVGGQATLEEGNAGR